MKRTTYILIGILVLGLLVLLAFVFYASVAGISQRRTKNFSRNPCRWMRQAFTP